MKRHHRYVVSATDVLREDHIHVMRFERVIDKCQKALYAGVDVPFSDIEKINVIISEFLDSIHYSREEDSYFPCVGVSGDFAEEVRRFLIEHQFGRNIAFQIARHLKRWKAGEDAREPVARFLRTYSIYLQDHVSKEEKFFDESQKVIDSSEEKEMYEYFAAVMATTNKVNDILKEIEALESQDWCK